MPFERWQPGAVSDRKFGNLGYSATILSDFDCDPLNVFPCHVIYPPTLECAV